MTLREEGPRTTPLAAILKERIAASGPLSVAEYMQLCLQHPEYGYYRVREGIGANGDFITAPEISQVFGELLGLWVAVVWQGMNMPALVNLVELGPGRGTLMADALRACRIVPGLSAALRVHLVESNAKLMDLQKTRLRDGASAFTWHLALNDIEGALGDAEPVVLLANEFLDTCPARQLVGQGAGTATRERAVGLDENGNLVFVVSAPGPDDVRASGAPHGIIVEVQDFRFLSDLSHAVGERPFAGLFIDYGHVTSAAGDTLQAVRAHRAEHVLRSPGEADLTVHVDFSAFAQAAAAQGFECEEVIAQGEFLGRLGLVERTSQLMAANQRRAGEIEIGAQRLMAPQGMGSRFKVIGLRRNLRGPLPGLD